MDTKIIGFAGKLGSGKTSCSNLIHALAFLNLIVDKDNQPITSRAWVNDQGGLMVAIDENTDQEIDIASHNPEAEAWLVENIWPFVKKFSCADPIKEFCVNVLGINAEYIYGSQEDKKQPTHLMWEDMPTNPWAKKTYVKKGPMTVREVMEYFGTEIVRKMYAPAWAKALVNNIQRWNPIIATIDDVRFLTEVEELKAAGAKIVRLTLTTEEAAQNTHQSNIELDNYDGFDLVIDNQNLTMEETFEQLVEYLKKIEWLQPNV